MLAPITTECRVSRIVTSFQVTSRTSTDRLGMPCRLHWHMLWGGNSRKQLIRRSTPWFEGSAPNPWSLGVIHSVSTFGFFSLRQCRGVGFNQAKWFSWGDNRPSSSDSLVNPITLEATIYAELWESWLEVLVGQLILVAVRGEWSCAMQEWHRRMEKNSIIGWKRKEWMTCKGSCRVVGIC